MQFEIDIARDFTTYPGPRYRRSGSYSAEQFREEKLVPALKRAVETGGTVVVYLDGVAGYGSSFLEETFGGLLRAPVNFTKAQLDKHLLIVARSQRFQHHAVRANSYISEEAARKAAGVH